MASGQDDDGATHYSDLETLVADLESMRRRGFNPTLRPGIMGQWGVTVLIGRNYIEAAAPTIEGAVASAMGHCNGYTTGQKQQKAKGTRD